MTIIVRLQDKRPTLVLCFRASLREIRLRDTRHRSSHTFVSQPCRDGVMTRSELTSSISNAGSSRMRDTSEGRS